MTARDTLQNSLLPHAGNGSDDRPHHCPDALSDGHSHGQPHRPSADMLDRLPAAVIQTDIFGRICYANRRAASLLGYSQEHLRSLSLAQLYDSHSSLDWSLIWSQLLLNRSLSRLGLFHHHDGTPLSAQMELALAEEDGQTVCMAVLSPLSQKTVDAALQQGREQLLNQLLLVQTLVDSIPSPIFAKDYAGRYLMCNKEFEHYNGLPREQLLGKSVFDLWVPELAQHYFEADQALFDSPGTQVYEAKVNHRDGSQRDVEFHKATFNDSSGQVAGMIGVMLDITKRKAAEEEIRYLAHYDPLTGLPNRSLLLDRMHQLLLACQRTPRPFSIFYLDLDGFKEINDRLGHATGDKVLQQAAALLRGSIREADTAARFGGDEFVVLLPNADRADTTKVAERIVQQFAEPIVVDAHACIVRASIGISVFPQDGDAEDVLLRGADTALYRRKAQGGDGYSYLSPEPG